MCSHCPGKPTSAIRPVSFRRDLGPGRPFLLSEQRRPHRPKPLPAALPGPALCDRPRPAARPYSRLPTPEPAASAQKLRRGAAGWHASLNHKASTLTKMSGWSRSRLPERDADPIRAPPFHGAGADNRIKGDQEIECLRYSHHAVHLQTSAGVRQIADGAIDHTRFVIENDLAGFERPVTFLPSPVFHRRLAGAGHLRIAVALRPKRTTLTLSARSSLPPRELPSSSPASSSRSPRSISETEPRRLASASA